jgi:diphthine-ammonia ligase
MKVAASWSGGKDSCFACFKAIQEGFEVSKLLTMMSCESASNFHMIRADMLDAQADAMGIPLTKRKTTPETYEQVFKSALQQLKTAGVQGLVTGDIYEVAMHEEGWLNRICREVGLKPIKPLWLRDTKQVFREFIGAGFEAVVVRVNTKVLGVEWLGRRLNEEFFADITKLATVDPCGEGGEYHTFVTDGPLFSKRIEILESRKVTLDGFGHLEISRFEVRGKEKGFSK